MNPAKYALFRGEFEVNKESVTSLGASDRMLEMCVINILLLSVFLKSSSNSSNKEPEVT